MTQSMTHVRRHIGQNIQSFNYIADNFSNILYEHINNQENIHAPFKNHFLIHILIALLIFIQNSMDIKYNDLKPNSIIRYIMFDGFKLIRIAGLRYGVQSNESRYLSNNFLGRQVMIFQIAPVPCLVNSVLFRWE